MNCNSVYTLADRKAKMTKSASKIRGISLFTGGGLFDVGIAPYANMVAGYELNEEIANWASGQLKRWHPSHVMHIGDVRFADFSCYAGIDYVHASPPCTRASRANPTQGESELDMELAKAIIRAIQQTRCKLFTLENVWQYREFAAFRHIVEFLKVNGWIVHCANFDSADYGVPQRRERLLLRAWKLPCALPSIAPTHCNPAEQHQLSLFGDLIQPWIGWHSAIADLLPSCPDSKLAQWQIDRLKNQYGDDWLRQIVGVADKDAELFLLSGGSLDSGSCPLVSGGDPAQTIKPTPKECQRVITCRSEPVSTGSEVHSTGSDEHSIGGSGYDGQVAHARGDQPAGTITTTVAAASQKVVYIGDTTVQGKHVCQCPGESPIGTIVTSPSHQHRVVFIEGQSKGERPPTICNADAPAPALCGTGGGALHRAILVDQTSRSERRCPTIRPGDLPSVTVVAGPQVREQKAVLVTGSNSQSNGRKGYGAEEPAPTLAASDCGQIRVVYYLTVKALTTRCLARLQCLPDTYELPEKRTLATTIVGNGVPCQMVAQVFGKSFLTVAMNWNSPSTKRCNRQPKKEKALPCQTK